MQTTGPGSRRDRERIDEYDLGQRFRRWAAQQQAQLTAFVFGHPRLISYSAVALVMLGVAWWMVANYRPAEPPPPRAAPMRQMMKAVEDADRRVRAEYSDRLGNDPEFQGVFETMRDIPVPLSGKSAQSSETQPKLPEVK